MTMRIELILLPTTDVDRSKRFYVDQVGFVLDHDVEPGNGMRVVQLTPPGSACSIAFGQGITTATPGSVEGMQVVVDDVHQARKELLERGVEVSDVQDFPWGSFVHFRDPDGNGWALQQMPANR
jgi:predicted enzyme related to lactoylglutathione lyase